MLQQTATLSSVNYGVSTHTIMTMGWDSFWKSHQCFRNFRRYSWNICNCMIIKEIYCKIAGAQKIWYISNSERFSTHYWLDLLAIKPNFTQNTELNLPLKLNMGPKCVWNCICIFYVLQPLIKIMYFSRLKIKKYLVTSLGKQKSVKCEFS